MSQEGLDERPRESIDRARVDVDPAEAMGQALALVARNARLGMAMGGERRLDVPAVPVVALREVVNPGLLPPGWRSPICGRRPCGCATV